MDSFRFIDTCLPLIGALPLAAAILTAVIGPWVARRAGRWQYVLALPVIVALAASCVLSLALVRTVQVQQQEQLDRDAAARQIATGFERIVTLWTWASVNNAYDLKSSDNSPPENATPTALDRGWKDFQIAVALRADALTAMMLGMVTFVSTLVAIFAAGYMAGDGGYWRFFAYIGLFVFSMTMLVSVSNFVLLYVFWEAVGLCSYLLIGFWYEKPTAVAAGMKAFLVNRVGDFGFAIALFLIWTTYGTLNFHDSLAGGSTDRQAIAAQLAAAQNSAAGENAQQGTSQVVRGVLGRSRLIPSDYVTDYRAAAICLLLLLGACGKSAQFPLHVWLPDAMEGPTPVSALIHAATMVTAGVYMIARCAPLFAASPEAQLTVATVGVITALLGGLIALTQFDLKRVLAYSTISQLGYMFLALGTGTLAGVTGGMYHLFTHAFFKALLFLGAGSVMHAMGGVIDMRKFGGLARLMPWTYATFLIGCLALCGIFPLSGFWSKDSILGAVHDKVHQLEHVREARRHPAAEHEPPERLTQSFDRLTDGQLAAYGVIYQGLYYAGLAAAFLTALYTFRAFCLTFHGEQRIPHEAGHHAHESPPVMTAPLAILAFCAIFVGIWALGVDNFLKGDWGRIGLSEFISQTPSLAAGTVALTAGGHKFHTAVAGVSTLVAVVGIGLAMYMYLGERNEVAFLQKLFDAQWADKLVDPQWVVELQRVSWIGAVARTLRQAGLGFVVTLVGLVLGTLSLIFALPLIVLRYLSPYKLSYGKFYFDEIYDALIVTPLAGLAKLCYWLDRKLVDALVDFAGSLPPAVGSLMRGLQGGLVQFYAIAMVLGVLILIAARLLLAG